MNYLDLTLLTKRARISLFGSLLSGFLPLSLWSHRKSAMTVAPLMLRSLIRLMATLLGQPVAAITTILYYGELLPENSVLVRMVRHDFLDRDNHLFHFLINFLRCF
ncbi:uncharacterized protein LOC116198972 isoform X2 [Punica granatum]|nr:uncharacterized protein LOC116198972 isoform X2 [Punica granatum]